jgi:hypothetical protein
VILLELMIKKALLLLHNCDTEYKLPPYLDSIQVAPEGEYRFKSTGEIVANPDFMDLNLNYGYPFMVKNI